MVRIFVKLAGFGRWLVIYVVVQEPSHLPTSLDSVHKKDSILMLSRLHLLPSTCPNPVKSTPPSLASSSRREHWRNKLQMSFNLTGVPQCGVSSAQNSVQSIDSVLT